MGELVRGHRRLRAWRRLGHGLYVPAGDRTLADDLRAWSQVLPPCAAFTHLTAARHRGWWMPNEIDQPLFVAALRKNRCPERSGLFVSQHKNSPPQEVIEGVPVTTSGETLLGAARDLGLLDLVLMGDSALRLGHCTLTELAAVCAQQRAGVVQLRHAVALLDGRSESAWESVMRVLHRAAEIDVEPQRRLEDPRGRFLGRADLWLVGTRRIHEYDGEIHRDREVHRGDLRRDRTLVEAGIERLGFTSYEVLHEGANIIASADRVLNRAWDSRRLARWDALVSDSLYGVRGRARARNRWRRALPPVAKNPGRLHETAVPQLQPSRTFPPAGARA